MKLKPFTSATPSQHPFGFPKSVEWWSEAFFRTLLRQIRTLLETCSLLGPDTARRRHLRQAIPVPKAAPCAALAASLGLGGGNKLTCQGPGLVSSFSSNKERLSHFPTGRNEPTNAPGRAQSTQREKGSARVAVMGLWHARERACRVAAAFSGRFFERIAPPCSCACAGVRIKSSASGATHGRRSLLILENSW